MVTAREVRFVLVVDDYEAAAHLYRDVFGLEVLMDLEADGGHGVILKLPAATAAGGEPMADVVDTPWGDRNQRFRSRDGVQLTLYQTP
jgi:uncharacterized glyoxalase superfamily protein PhnB